MINCFVLTFQSEQDRDRMYWLLYGLWQNKTFQHSLVGSVVPFIRIGEFVKLVSYYTRMYAQSIDKFDNTVATMKIIAKAELAMQSTMKLMEVYKQIAFDKMTKGA